MRQAIFAIGALIFLLASLFDVVLLFVFVIAGLPTAALDVALVISICGLAVCGRSCDHEREDDRHV